MRTAAAMLLALLLGVGGGVTAALLTQTDAASTLAGRPGAGPSTRPSTRPSTLPDPLDLAVGEQDLECGRGYVRVVSQGDTAAELAAGIADNLTDHPHYLEVSRSCGNVWVDPEKGPEPTYVAYTGPYAHFTVPCQARMQDRGSTVAHLRAGNRNLVKCVCALGPAAGPTLVPDDPGATETDDIWARSLQGMLVDMGRLPASDQTGVYDAATVAAVEQLQTDGHAEATGVMDENTWRLLIGRTCGVGLYDW